MNFLFEKLNELNSTVIEVEAKRLYGEKEKGVATLKTTSDPIISDDGKTYSAEAIDVFENKYLLVWDVIDPEITDESSICDWNNPSQII